MEGLKEVPQPIGKFLIEREYIERPILNTNGAYYHFVDVIEAMREYGNQIYNQAIRDAAEITPDELKQSILELIKPE